MEQNEKERFKPPFCNPRKNKMLGKKEEFAFTEAEEQHSKEARTTEYTKLTTNYLGSDGDCLIRAYWAESNSVKQSLANSCINNK